MSCLIERIASDEILEQAYEWLCKKRNHYHFNADVWQLRRSWCENKLLIQKLLLSGKFKFRELKLVKTRDKVIEWWHSIDALVLKAISIVLREHLSPHLSSRCFHLSGTGGIYGAVEDVGKNLEDNTFVFRTDVKSYYASINHDVLMGK